MPDLTGNGAYQLDSKGRVVLPSKYREAFSEGVLYLTLGQDGCLYAFPQQEWDRQKAEIERAPLAGAQARAYARMFFGNAEAITLDAQGRLLIPQRLRTLLGPDREVVVVGVSTRLEIWTRERWDVYERELAGAYTSGTLTPEDPGR